MEKQKMINLLKRLCGIYRTEYDLIVLFSNEFELIESDWMDYRRNNNLWSKPTYKDAITFSNCVKSNVYTKNDEIYVDYLVWDGDSYYGIPEKKRCEFTFKLVDYSGKYAEMLKISISNKIYSLAYNEYEQKLEQEKTKIIKKIYNKILNEYGL